MSQIENTVYLESVQDLFNEAIANENFVGAASLVDKLKADGFTNEAIWLQKELKNATDEVEYQENQSALTEWLEERGLHWYDVMDGEEGRYVFIESEDGVKKTYLPDNF